MSDNSGKDIEVDIDVYYDGKTVSTYDGGFYADNQGEYFVRITATDMSGNSSVSEYKITVDKGGCSSMLDTSGTIGLILLLSAIALVYYTMIKKHKEI